MNVGTKSLLNHQVVVEIFHWVSDLLVALEPKSQLEGGCICIAYSAVVKGVIREIYFST